jgi:hypothetical protein
MAEVDPDDDDLQRFVVRHYRYDRGRRQRRHVTVAAIDDERQFQRDLEARSADLRARRQCGEAVDEREHISGVTLEPGDRSLAAKGHAVRKAVEHGVSPHRLLTEPDLPAGMRLFSANREGEQT